jgi:hypothetical protein
MFGQNTKQLRRHSVAGIADGLAQSCGGDTKTGSLLIGQITTMFGQITRQEQSSDVVGVADGLEQCCTRGGGRGVQEQNTGKAQGSNGQFGSKVRPC